MCLAIPGRVTGIDGARVTVQYPGQSRIVLSGGESVKIGDHVLVQMGIIIQIISPRRAAASLRAWTS